jgi:hypothetical protein
MNVTPQERADILQAIEAIKPARSTACIHDCLFEKGKFRGLFGGRWLAYDTNFITMQLKVKAVKGGA